MKYDSPLMARLQAATQQLLKNGPLGAAATMDEAGDPGAWAGAAPNLKDLNEAPQYAASGKRGFGGKRAAPPAPPADDAGNDAAPGTHPAIAAMLDKLGVKLPQGFKMPEGVQMPEGFKMPEGFTLPEGINLPEGPAMRKRTPPPPLPEGATFEAGTFTNHAGTRSYKLYVPSNYDAGTPMPLVVMLHGCTQDPDDFAAGTKMNLVGEESGCLVLYPAQPQSANQSRCWNWFSKNDQQRERGEPAIIAGMTRQVMTQYAVDADQVSIAGLSAGGAMAVIVGALYPELYQAVGVHSGLPFGAAHDLPAALQAMKAGAPGRKGGAATRPVIVFHGDKDHTVAAVNAEQVLADALAPHGSGQPASETAKAPGGRKYTRDVHTSRDGTVVAEHWVLHGGGHAWAGGSPSGSYTDCKGPDASREMVRFFKAVAAARQA